MSTSGNSVNAVTLHDYYLNGRTAVKEDFLDPNLMDGLNDKVKVFKQAFPDQDIWLGETGSAFGGGAKGISNRYRMLKVILKNYISYNQ